MLGQNRVQFLAQSQDFPGVDFNFRSLALYAAQRLVNHDIGMRKGETLALGAGRKKYGRHAGTGTNTDGGYIRLDVLHSIVNSQTGSNYTTRAVDVKINILIRIFRF